MDIKQLYALYVNHPSVQTDTRKLREGDIYFALKGPNFNGNLFANKALEAGASWAIVDEPVANGDPKIIQVDNTLRTLQSLASLHRDQFNIPFIAITGSNGKTTTKELVHSVLSSSYKTYTTEGNLNNHIGVPLTLLKIRRDAQMAVIEMGANHRFEIESYCRYAKPDYGLITNIGKAHLEGFGGIDGVKKGKGELFDFLRYNDGTAFVNADDEKVLQLSESLIKKVLYGKNTGRYEAEMVSGDPFLTINIKGEHSFSISSHLVGNYNLSNILAAVTIGSFFNVPTDKIKTAIEAYLPSNSRSQMVHKGSNIFIMDAYNANPGSMKVAIENFAAMEGKDKVLILGAMKELGEESKAEHEALVNLIEKYAWKEVALAGNEFKVINHPYHYFENASQAKEWFLNQHFENAIILLKGSRSMQMEKVVE